MASSAKRSKARKAKIKKAAPPKLRATSVAPVAGPVTLDEAKAIVRAKQPKLAMHEPFACTYNGHSAEKQKVCAEALASR